MFWMLGVGASGVGAVCSTAGGLNPMSEAFGGGATAPELFSPSSSLLVHFLATGSQTIVGLLSSGNIIWFFGFGASLLNNPPNQEPPVFAGFFSGGFSCGFFAPVAGFDEAFGVSRASSSSSGSYYFLVDGVIEIAGWLGS